ncbi:MAG: response regulator [Lachnospiraceae bacterium]|nr:response regulator [Lachnospiraceae bacterium]
MEQIKRMGLEEVVRGIPGGFFIYKDCPGEEIVYVNQEVAELFGCDTVEEVRAYVGNSFRGIVHPDDLERVENSIYDQIRVKGRMYDFVEYRIITKSGEVRWVEDFGHIVNSSAFGNVFYVFITDVTERIEEKQANNIKTVFLANMSHDIRTPMNAIIGFAELGLMEGQPLGKMRECLEKIQESAQGLLGLIDDILDMRRIETGKMSIISDSNNLYEIIKEANQIIEAPLRKRQMKYTCDTSGIRHPNVRCDALRVKQVLNNLLGNAVKFTRPGGSISLTVRQFDSLSHGVATYEFVVEDTGIGIAPECLPKLFLPFERERTSTVTKTQGTGLGLPITKNIVDMMNGSIHVDSRVGEGSTFTVRLPFPVTHETVQEQMETKEMRTPSLAGKYVLLAEDNELNREIAKELLQGYGLVIEEAEDGDVAVEMVKSSGGKYDIVLMDIQMVRMDGYQAAREIRSLPDPSLASVPIVALSANAFEEDKQKAIENGMNGHLTKPMDMRKVLHMMGELLLE